MREILFRGRTIVNHQWVEGFFMKSPAGKCYIYNNNLRPFLVDPSSVGQFTGLYDHSEPKIRIFEGDIIKVTRNVSYTSGSAISKTSHHCVIYGDRDADEKDNFYPAFNLSPSTDIDCESNELEIVARKSYHDIAALVVGNIIDNPDLL